MMLALRSSIQQSFTGALNKQMSALDEVGERVNHVENKMGEFSEAHNSLVDAHNHLEDELSSLATMLADLLEIEGTTSSFVESLNPSHHLS